MFVQHLTQHLTLFWVRCRVRYGVRCWRTLLPCKSFCVRLLAKSRVRWLGVFAKSFAYKIPTDFLVSKVVVSRKQTHSLYYPNSPRELSSFSLRKQAKEPVYAMFHNVKPIEFSVNSHRKKHYFQNFLPFSKKLSYLCPRTLATSLRGGASVTFVGNN